MILFKLAIIGVIMSGSDGSQKFIKDLNSTKQEVELTKTKADSLYDAISGAEHRWARWIPGYDMWTRTRHSNHGPSNAYGPVQLLSNTVANIPMTKEGKPMIDYTQEELDFIERYKAQGDLFYKHGKMKGKLKDYDPRFDYGGAGLGYDDAEKALYNSVAKKIIDYEYNRAGGDLDTFIKSWRFGNDPNLGYEDDKEYFDYIRKHMGE